MNGGQSSESPESVPSHRARVTQACDQCRLGRRKCDSSQPTCHACSVFKLECSYKQTHRKRGKPTGYIWALEVTLALLLDEDPGNAETIRQFVASDEADRERRVSVYNERLMKQLHTAWRDSETLKDINAMLRGDNPPPINYKPRGRAPEERPKWFVDPAAQGDLDAEPSQWPLL